MCSSSWRHSGTVIRCVLLRSLWLASSNDVTRVGSRPRGGRKNEATGCSLTSIRTRPIRLSLVHGRSVPVSEQQVSMPIAWDAVNDVDPNELTIATVPGLLDELGDAWSDYGSASQSLEPLLAFHERDMAAGMMDAPWPPVYPKQPNEPPRVAPSRAKKPE